MKCFYEDKSVSEPVGSYPRLNGLNFLFNCGNYMVHVVEINNIQIRIQASFPCVDTAFCVKRGHRMPFLFADMNRIGKMILFQEELYSSLSEYSEGLRELKSRINSTELQSWQLPIVSFRSQCIRERKVEVE